MQNNVDIYWVRGQIKPAKKPEEQQRMYVDHRGEVFQWSTECKDIGKMVWLRKNRATVDAQQHGKGREMEVPRNT